MGIVQPINDWVEIWVPWKGSGTEEDPYRADVPEFDANGKGGVDWWTDYGAAGNADPSSPDAGKPLCAYYCINVKRIDLAKCTQRVAESLIPERDKKLIAMHRACYRDWESKVDGFFDSQIGVASTEAQRELGRELLRQANLKGLSTAKADAIRERLSFGTMVFENDIDRLRRL